LRYSFKNNTSAYSEDGNASDDAGVLWAGQAVVDAGGVTLRRSTAWVGSLNDDTLWWHIERLWMSVRGKWVGDGWLETKFFEAISCFPDLAMQNDFIHVQD
jgi:hypothetical protein